MSLLSLAYVLGTIILMGTAYLLRLLYVYKSTLILYLYCSLFCV